MYLTRSKTHLYCSFEVNIYKYGNTEIPLTSNFISTKNIIVYPNPFTTQINIQTSNSLSIIELFDVNGYLVLQSKSGEKSLDTANLPSGIYILRQIDGHNMVRQMKIIKQ